MRLEIVDRKRLQHAVVLAQIVLLLCAPAWGARAQQWKSWGERGFAGHPVDGKPLLVMIGDSTSHDWKPQHHPAFAPVILDRLYQPYAAAAYERFAAVMGVKGDPLYVVLTPHLEPVAGIDAASPSRTAQLDDLAARWSRDRAQLLAAAGLSIRRHLFGAAPAARPERSDIPALIASGRYDAIGGGFFRGLRNEAAHLPRFDKSLIEQVQLAGQALTDPSLAEIVRATLDYILAELPEKNGAFRAGQHADSLVARKGPELLEGGHYLWKTAEVRHLLGSPLGDIVLFHYRATEEGNIPPALDPAGDFRGLNLLTVAREESETRARFRISEQELRDALTRARQVLLEVRTKRPDPVRHPGIITAHNAAAVSVLAHAFLQLGDERYRDAAIRAAKAVLMSRTGKHLQRAEGVDALSDDYAFAVRALLDAYAITFEDAFIARAVELQKERDGIADAMRIPAPVAALAVEDPMVVSTTAANLAKLGSITGSAAWLQRADAAVLAGHRQVIVAGVPGREDTQALLRSARSSSASVFFATSPQQRARLAQWMPYVSEVVPQGAEERKAVATVCQQRTCRTPTSDPAVLDAWLK